MSASIIADDEPEVRSEPQLTPREMREMELLEQYDNDAGYEPNVSLPEAMSEQPLVAEQQPISEHNERQYIYQADDGTQYVKLKVNGVDVEKPLDKAIADLQKIESADRRLADAAEKIKEITAREQEIAAREMRVNLEAQALDIRLQQANNGKQTLLGADDVVESIFLNDEDAPLKLKALVEDIVNANHQVGNPPIDDSVLDKKVKEALAQRDFEQSLAIGRQRAMDILGDRYNDPDFNIVLEQNCQRIATTDPTLRPEQVIEMAAANVADKFNLTPRKQQQSSDLQAVDPRLAAKQEMPRPVFGQRNSGSVSSDKVQPIPETDEQIIEAERNERYRTRGVILRS